MNTWNPLEERPALESVWVRDVEVRKGARVRLRPSGRADILDIALEGKTAIVEAIEQILEGQVYLAVTVEDDPGKDLGEARKIAHRFFFRPDEVEPLEGKPT
jgi:hypothetical protein